MAWSHEDSPLESGALARTATEAFPELLFCYIFESHLFNLFYECVLCLDGKILDGVDDVLLLRALHGRTQDQQEQLVHLVEALEAGGVLADDQRVGEDD